ncbi:ATP-binding cassette domain-containing protein [Spongiactinospora sp. TRM90649]|uniref:ATP-binding cassette domain-containing protein n=1 Tax=Spongiactinospora sp. TRM90649 TaxID=3031114 RepID=UPI0023F9E5C5|nr:ATP-binding cassette domain-containing protein [Spongiactinospora sp. TRM90649]MDF5752884.1 ATP-binding cassette domain-containing protein [Spongiactinospora sp. TRM90649]
MDAAIEARGLEKSFGQMRVLTGVDLHVPAGTVAALLGPNGAGKTTTIRILATLLRADGGQARVAGHDVVRERSEVRRSISLTGQYAAVDALQTGQENLRMMARLRGLTRRDAHRRATELLERFDLSDAGGRRVGTYSGGMRRRLDLAASLVVPPAVIFLDEPTTGLDPRSRQTMWGIITDLVDTGVTVFLTTQYLEEADRLAGSITVIDGGTVIASGTADELKRQVAAARLDLVMASREAYAEAAALLGGRVVHADQGRLTISVATDGGAAHVRAVLDEVDPGRAAVATFGVHSATLDDVFLTLTGRATTGQKEHAHG